MPEPQPETQHAVAARLLAWARAEGGGMRQLGRHLRKVTRRVRPAKAAAAASS